jgi:hypothetical protein
VFEQFDEQGDVGADAEHGIAAQRGQRAPARGVACVAPGNQLGQQRIVVHADFGSLRDTGIDADAGHRRLAVEEKRARLWEIVAGRIFGVDADFDRMATLADGRLRPGQRLTRRNRQLGTHEVHTGDLFRDRMLDLKTRVHLEKVEPSIVTAALEEELHGAGVAVSGRARHGDRSFTHQLPH